MKITMIGIVPTVFYEQYSSLYYICSYKLLVILTVSNTGSQLIQYIHETPVLNRGNDVSIQSEQFSLELPYRPQKVNTTIYDRYVPFYALYFQVMESRRAVSDHVL